MTTHRVIEISGLSGRRIHKGTWANLDKAKAHKKQLCNTNKHGVYIVEEAIPPSPPVRPEPWTPRPTQEKE